MVEAGRTQLIKEESDGELVAQYGDFELRSHLQPILSSEEDRRCALIGAEALVRVRKDDVSLSVEDFFSNIDLNEMRRRDQLCRMLHLTNFATVNDGESRLFLNIFPESCVENNVALETVTKMMGYLVPLGIRPQQLVCEIIEAQVDDLSALRECTDQIRKLGALIAIDDFGCRFSNIDRIFELQPDIVKLDAMIVRRAGELSSGPKMLSTIIRMIHEMGALALVEGIEGRKELDIAVDGGADLLQGYFIGRPAVSSQAISFEKKHADSSFL